ncbi:MAG: hypothetical protein HOV66_12225, partial [Streptomycetaceae bacterium]|nr:hypothetical protein [Streptomycetaceae bacterium]
MPKPAKARAKAPRRPHLLGVRHHGPGSARAVAAALAATAPDIVLVEGPPEADLLLSYAADPEMVPPVALLAHAKDDPGQAGFWPYAEFSPEWAAIRYALDHGVPVRFIDLPAGCGFALDRARAARRNAAPEPDPEPTRAPDTHDIPDIQDIPHPPIPGESHRTDPIAVLARVAGHDDPERWWEDAVEHQAGGADPLAPFALLAEAMGALREPPSAPAPAGPDGPVATAEDAETAGTTETTEAAEDLPDLEAAREAHMRLAIDTAYRQGFREVAVVCGAWHVPALAASRPVAEDRAVLAPFAALTRGGALPRVKVETTWVPWTYRRLGQVSGYGAGVPSPGWYHHLFATEDRERLLPAWFVRVAELFRTAGRPVSPAHVIEAVRHAETLAALRGRPLAGLDETLEAVRAVMCDGDDAPLALVHDDIVVGDRIGAVPATVPAVPLQRDLDAQRKRLSLTLADRKLELDLRKTLDADRSRLFTRLTLLDIPWGTPTASRRGTGTFRETWTLAWQPELAIRVAEAGVWGTTVLGAATAHAVERAACAGSL